MVKLKNRYNPFARILQKINDISTVETNLAILAFKVAINNSLTLYNMVDGIIDNYADESGINNASSQNESYDADGDFYISSQEGGSDVTQGTSPTASTEFGGNPVGNAVDDNLGTQWVTTEASGWIKIDLGVARNITSYTIRNDSETTAPRDWTFEGSNTGDFSGEETIVDTRASETGWNPNGEKRTYEFANSESFRYYRLNMTETNGGVDLHIIEYEMFEPIVINNLELISIILNAEDTPQEARIILLTEEVDSITLNTDLIVSISRDGGITFSQATLIDEGDFDSTRRVLTGTADLGSQSLGTSMIYKIETLNDKQTKIHSCALFWS